MAVNGVKPDAFIYEILIKATCEAEREEECGGDESGNSNSTVGTAGRSRRGW
jgi:hypothetical protein